MEGCVQLGLAEVRQQQLIRLADCNSTRAARLWQRKMTADFDVSWRSFIDQVLTFTAVAQVQVAQSASPYLNRYATADDADKGDGATIGQAWAGVDASGREAEGLLYGAVTTAKTRVGQGAGVQSALMSGATYLAVMVSSLIHDTARSAELTAMTSHSYVEWQRVVNPGACSRCAILAGKQSAQKAFLRHPRCRCTAAPRRVDDDYDGKYANPTDYFNSLDAAEQDRVFTKAGAEAIRAGADPQRIVAARRGGVGIDYGGRSVTSPNSSRRLQRTRIGTRPDGSAIMGYTTSEGVTAKGAFGRQNLDVRQQLGQGSRRRRVRLMPETLIGLTDDVDLRKALLRDAGYLDVPFLPGERDAALGGGYAQRRLVQLAEDRQRADALYRSLGIAVG